MSLPCTVQYVHKHGGPGQARHQEGGGGGGGGLAVPKQMTRCAPLFT